MAYENGEEHARLSVSLSTQDCQIPLKNLKIGPDLTELGMIRS